MSTIQAILDKYRPKIDNLDLELILAHELKKTREFVLTYPEFQLTKIQDARCKRLIARRLHREPLAYILGHKEFYGLDLEVTKDTLIPRPETEILIEQALLKIPAYAEAPAGRQETCLRQGFGGQARNLPTPPADGFGQASKKQRVNIIDVGTGSGNIIISIAKTIESKNLLHASCYMLYGIDISEKALTIAKHNAKKHSLTKIKFIKSNLLDHFLKNNQTIKQFNNLIILANLPYLSREIYSATAPTVKNFEPKSALYSPKAGLDHYEKLLKQIKLLTNYCSLFTVHCFMEISPEQKKSLNILVKKILPSAEIKFEKDLAEKWRVCKVSLI